MWSADETSLFFLEWEKCCSESSIHVTFIRISHHLSCHHFLSGHIGHIYCFCITWLQGPREMRRMEDQWKDVSLFGCLQDGCVRFESAPTWQPREFFSLTIYNAELTLVRSFLPRGDEAPHIFTWFINPHNGDSSQDVSTKTAVYQTQVVLRFSDGQSWAEKTAHVRTHAAHRSVESRPRDSCFIIAPSVCLFTIH